jgi:hypothetical protein
MICMPPAKKEAPMPKAPAKHKTARRKSNGDDLRRYHFKANPEAPRIFEILDEKWAAKNLPVVKVTAHSLLKDWKQHREMAGKLYDKDKGWDPVVAETFRQFDAVHAQLMGMAELIEGAEARWLVSCAYFALPPRGLRKVNQRRLRNEGRRSKLYAAKIAG